MNASVDDIDLVLRHAGTDWCAGQPPAPVVDLDRLRSGRRQPPRRWVPALAAAAVAAVAVAGLMAIPNRSEPDVAGDPPAVVDQVRSQLLVRNGDEVRVTGLVIAAPGRDVILCTATISIMVIDGRPPSCPRDNAITVTGADLGQLDHPRTVRGIRSGVATLWGRWADRRIAVHKQSRSRMKPWAVPERRPDKPFDPERVARANAAMLDYIGRHDFGGWFFGWRAAPGERGVAFPPVIDEQTLAELRRIGLGYFVWIPAVVPVR